MLRSNLSYGWVVLRHKWYVLRFGWGSVPLWRLLVHDASKFSRAEWGPYRDRFASGRAGKEDKALDPQAFKNAWEHHWQTNPHHWEHWVVRPDVRWGEVAGSFMMMREAPNGAVEMPETYVREMIADWKAASKAYSGKNSCIEWYEATKDRQIMHPNTRALVERLLGIKWRDVDGAPRFDWSGWALDQERRRTSR